jgi:hypothetical protein
MLQSSVKISLFMVHYTKNGKKRVMDTQTRQFRTKRLVICSILLCNSGWTWSFLVSWPSGVLRIVRSSIFYKFGEKDKFTKSRLLLLPSRNWNLKLLNLIVFFKCSLKKSKLGEDSVFSPICWSIFPFWRPYWFSYWDGPISLFQHLKRQEHQIFCIKYNRFFQFHWAIQILFAFII